MTMVGYELGDVLYENSLSKKSDIEDFILEGQAEIYFVKGRMRMENKLDPKIVGNQKGNFVFWCPEEFPSNIAVKWEFKPLNEPGLAMMFFSAKGRNGEDIFDEVLSTREGIYKQYNRGDINAYHVSYYRRRLDKEIDFHTCNLRKSYGFHLVSTGPDPIPNIEDIKEPYYITLIKYENEISFYIYNPYTEKDQLLFKWIDDGEKYDAVLGEGKIGLRQMAPLIGEYANLKVYNVTKKRGEN
jgi:hypothetical protein